MLILIYIILLAAGLLISKKVNKKNWSRFIFFGINFVFAFTVLLYIGHLYYDIKTKEELTVLILKNFMLTKNVLTFNNNFSIYDEIYNSLANGAIVKQQVYITMFLISCSTLSVFISFFEKTIHAFFYWLKTPFKEQIIIVGNNSNASYLALDILKTDAKKLILFITDDEFKHLDDLDYKNLRVKNPQSYIGYKWKEIKKNKKYSIALLLKNKDDNIQILKELEEVNKKINKGYEDLLKVTVLADNKLIRFDIINNIVNDIKLNVCLVSEEQLIMAEIMKKHLPAKIMKEKEMLNFTQKFDIAKVTKTFMIGIIGFDSLGEEFLLSTFENSRFLMSEINDTMNLKALIIDERMSRIRREFLEEVPYFKEYKEIEFSDVEIGSESYYKLLLQKLPYMQQIFIAFNDNEINIHIAKNIIRVINNYEFTNNPEIIVCLNNSNYSKGLFNINSNVHIINNSTNIFSYNNIIERKIDDDAKEYLKVYLEGKGDYTEEGWNNLTTFEKESNRAAARDIKTKHILCDDINKLNNEVALENLARYEHNRWCAFHLSRGWTSMKNPDYKIRKIPEKKMHSCLVDWDKLEELDKIYNRDFKGDDKNNVKLIEKLYID